MQNPIDEDTRCSNAAQRANTATKPCHPTHSKRAFARTNARSVHGALKASSRTSAQTAAARSCPGQFGRRRTGGATTFSANTPPARGSGTSPSIPRHMQRSLPQSRTFHRSGDRGRGNAISGVWRYATRYALRKACLLHGKRERVYVITQDVVREEPALTRPGFRRSLEWLDDGVESHAGTYLEMRRRLTS